MINLKNFDCILKLKWFKLLLKSSGGWSLNPCYMNIDKVAKYGIDYTKVQLEKINNPVRQSVVESIKLFFKLYYNYHTQELICSQPLWFNPLINLEYVSRWDNK